MKRHAVALRAFTHADDSFEKGDLIRNMDEGQFADWALAELVRPATADDIAAAGTAAPAADAAPAAKPKPVRRPKKVATAKAAAPAAPATE